MGGAIGAAAGALAATGAALISGGASMISSGLAAGGGMLALAGGGTAAGSGAAAVVAGVGAVALGGTLVLGGAAVGIAGLNALYKIDYQGKPNSTITSGGSTGTYDENGNLIARRDTGHAHFIKELQAYYMPHTHRFKWKLINGIWRIIERWVLPY